MNYNQITENIKQIISLEAKVETDIKKMLDDFDNYYYFEIDIKTDSNPDKKLIWLSFYLPVISSTFEKEIIEIGFTLHLDLRENNNMTYLEFNEQKVKLNQKQIFLMFLGKDLEKFSGFTKVGNISKEEIDTHLKRCYISTKQSTDNCNFHDFISQVNEDYILPFLNNAKFSKYNNMVKPDTTEATKKITEAINPIIKSIKTKELLSPAINNLFFKKIVNSLEGHEQKSYFTKLDSKLIAKPEGGKIKI